MQKGISADFHCLQTCLWICGLESLRVVTVAIVEGRSGVMGRACV